MYRVLYKAENGLGARVLQEHEYFEEYIDALLFFTEKSKEAVAERDVDWRYPSLQVASWHSLLDNEYA